MSFEKFKLKPEIQKSIQELGFETPTPIQEQAIPILLDNKDIIGCAQTGTGKTAAFSLPILQQLEKRAPGSIHPKALIITPTRELASQVHESIQDFSRHLPFKSLVLYGGTPKRPQTFQIKQGADIIIATPGRLLDHLESATLRLYDVKFLVLDEADRMLDMGFIPDIEDIMTYLPRKRQTLLFSATMPPMVDRLAHSITQEPEIIVIGHRTSVADTVEQSIYCIKPDQKFDLLVDIIKTQDINSIVIFTSTKIGAANLAKDLTKQSIVAASIHSNLPQIQRERVLDGFKQGKYNVLVATDVIGRGLDIDHISHVVNFDTPTYAEDYVHRIGRTGRASSKGTAYTFTTNREMKYLNNIEKLINMKITKLDENGNEITDSKPFSQSSQKRHSSRSSSSRGNSSRGSSSRGNSSRGSSSRGNSSRGSSSRGNSSRGNSSRGSSSRDNSSRGSSSRGNSSRGSSSRDNSSRGSSSRGNSSKDSSSRGNSSRGSSSRDNSSKGSSSRDTSKSSNATRDSSKQNQSPKQNQATQSKKRSQGHSKPQKNINNKKHNKSQNKGSYTSKQYNKKRNSGFSWNNEEVDYLNS